MKNATRNFLLGMLLLVSGMLGAQGTTTGSITGNIADANQESLIGATVVATHTPTGTVYGTVTDADGNYRFSNIKVGGPYTIDVTYVGYQNLKQTDVYVQLGEKLKLNYMLQSDAVALEEIVVSGTSANAGQTAGAQTQIGQDQIELMPTTGRDLRDYTRLTPQIKESFGGGISIAGINNRYNAIYVDGAANNDMFGLAGSGTNGGQTGISPFSPDILDQIQVVVSPYDVTLGGFAGGGINAVTKSGTNEWEGTAYFYTQNESLVGETNTTLTERTGGDQQAVDEFTSNIYGASIAGPIIKDKLFFFGNVEIQEDETPVPFDVAAYEGDTDEAGLEGLRNTLIDRYGYDPGNFGSKTDALDGLKLFGKLNYNINDNHKLVLRHQYTSAEQNNVNGSSQRTINFQNNGIYFPSVTNSTALELNSTFGTGMSNNLIIGYTTVRDDRDPIGGDFPYVRIEDGEGTIEFGSEQFSTANQLDQDVLTITDNFKLYRGDHTITIGTHNEFLSVYNLFIRQNYGSYRFSSLQAFLDGEGAGEYDRSYSLVDNVTGDGSAAAAEFNAMQLGVYIQDEWSVSRDFTLTAGVRLDMPIITDDPNVDPGLQAVIDGITAYDTKGAVAGEAPAGQLMWSPRVGFNYDLKGDQSTVLRGGVGIFTSRIPFVWPGGMFTNNGITIGGLNERDLSDPIEFIPNFDEQYTNPNFTVPSGQVDLFAEDFKYPQVFRASLAVDHDFGYGLTGSLEGIYTKTLNNVNYTNINSDPEVLFQWEGADDRNVYTGNRLNDQYTAIYLATNTDQGDAYTITGRLDKDFGFGMRTGLAWTYGDATALFEGTSSQNSSQWRGQFHVNGRNFSDVARSDFSMGHRIVGYLSYTQNWGGSRNFATSVGLFYNGESGQPYSYVYNNGDVNRNFASNPNDETGSTSRNRSLIWIPADQSEINLIDIPGGPTAAEQWEALNKFIEDDDYLSENRGGYAEKNGARAPWTNIFDFKIMQNVGVEVNGRMHRFQITLDIENFGNLLNSDWGVRYNNPFDYRLINWEGYALDDDGMETNIPIFTFTEDDLGLDRFNIWDLGSRWNGRLGVRYIFGKNIIR